MVKRTIVSLVDDLDNREIDSSGQTIRFALQDAQYELDLSADNVKRLQDALAPFLAAARRVGGPTVSVKPKIDPEQLRGMRQWAKDHGFSVSERGRLAKEVQDAYHSASR